MNETKLTQVLRKLSKDDFREFGKFVRSPYFNERTRLVKLYDVLKQYYPGFDQDDFTREVIFMKLYPGEKYNDSKLRSGFTGLFKLTWEYLSYNEYKNDRFLVKNNLLIALNKNGLDKFFVKYLNNSENDINKNETSFIDIFYRTKELKDLKIDFNLKHDKQILISEEVIKREEYSVYHFILQFLNGYADMVCNQYSFKTEFKGSTADEFLKCVDLEKFMNYLKKSRNRYYSIIAMNYYILRAIVQYEDETHFSNFMKLFNKFIDTFTRNDQFHFYRRLESYLVITHHIRSSSENEKMGFGIYRQMLAKKLYSHENEGYFSHSFFNNIFFVALQLKEYKWLDVFISNYIDKLRPEIRTDMLNICTAYIEFRKGNFEDALDSINKVNYEQYQFKLTVKYLMLQIYYEINEFEQLYSLIDTSRHFLAKNKLMSEAPVERYLSFIRFIASLAKYKSGFGTSGLDELKKEIIETKNVSGKDWLLEKAEEL